MDECFQTSIHEFAAAEQIVIFAAFSLFLNLNEEPSDLGGSTGPG